MGYLFDTNAVINFLKANGDFSFLDRDSEIAISFITYIELSVGFKHKSEEKNCSAFLSKVKRIAIDDKIMTKTIEYRIDTDLKIPDSIIIATADTLQLILVTSDKKILAKISNLDIETRDPLS